MRNKSIEMMVVMMLLVLFTYVVFVIIQSGTEAYSSINENKQNTMYERTAVSYISMKVKQNDTSGRIKTIMTEYGDTLYIDEGEYATYIFYADGGLYECFTSKDNNPEISASNLITSLDGFSLKQKDNLLEVKCLYVNEENSSEIQGVIGIRSNDYAW